MNRIEKDSATDKKGKNTSNIKHKLLEFVMRSRKGRAWYIVLMTFAVAVAFITTYRLILPAVTIEKKTAKEMPGISLAANENREERSTSSSNQSGEDIKNDMSGDSSSDTGDGKKSEDGKEDKDGKEYGDDTKSDNDKLNGAGGKSEDDKADGADGKSEDDKLNGADGKNEDDKLNGTDGKSEDDKADGADGKSEDDKLNGADGKNEDDKLNGADGKKEDDKADGADSKSDDDKESGENKNSAPDHSGSEYISEPLVRKTRSYVITLSFDQDAHIPKGTRFDVETIVKGSPDYKMYEEALKKKSRNLTGAAYYRLKLTKDGKEIHPKKPVEVSFFERIKTEKKVERAVFFFEGKKALKEDPEARLIAVDSSEKGSATDNNSGVDRSRAGTGADHEDDDEGSDDSDIVKEADSADSTRMVDEGSRIILSNIPFHREEVLPVIGLASKAGTESGLSENGNRNLAKSSNESDDLRDFLTRVAVSGAPLINGKYVVQEGKPYAVTMTFKESPQVQFDNDAILTYQVPAGVIIPENATMPLNIAIVSKGRTYEVPGTITANTNGEISVSFETEHPNFVYLEDATNVSFRITVNAQFTDDIEKTAWSTMVERDIILDRTGESDVYVTKSGVFDEQTGIFTYTIKVKASGTPENVNVKDIISGEALSFNNDVQITGYSREPVKNVPKVGCAFDYTFPSMNDGEEITITYTASVNPSYASDGTVTAEQTKNSVLVQKEHGEPHTAEYSHSINLVNLDKKDGEFTGNYVGEESEGKLLYSWRIDYNTLALVSVAGDTIKDMIASTSQDYMTYYGDVTVKVLNSLGQQVGTDTFTPGDSSWEYVIPAEPEAPYHYVFEYQTVVDRSKVDPEGQTVPIMNTVTGRGQTDTGVIYVSPIEETIITKAVEASSPEEVAWVSRIHVPESGLTSAVVTDTVPYITANQLGHEGDNSTTLYDTYLDGSLEVEGQLEGETYEVKILTDKVVITFYMDPNKNQEGLQGNPGGHDITIKLKTKVNKEWLQYGYDHPSSYQATHWNTISINGNTAYADVTFAEPGFKKTGSDATGAMNSKHFLYTLVLSGVSETPINIEDTFDTDLLEVATDMSYSGWYFKIWGGDQYDQSHGETSVNYSDTPTGIRITANDVPLQENGEYYPYYRIRYYLKLKDGVNLDDLAIENGGKFDLTNEAVWGDHTAEYTFTTEYDFLDKELEKEAKETDRRVKYRITYNPAKAELNGGQDLVMTDTLNENLSIDYSSVTITTDPPGRAVPYEIGGDPTGNGGTIAKYTIPDSTKVVITYDAMVIGNGAVYYKNVVKANGVTETVDKTITFNIAGVGDGATADLKVVKVDHYDGSKKLAGVQFRLYSPDRRENGERYDLSLDNSGVYEKVLTTDENGVIAIDGTKIKIYFGVKYYLEEIAPPDGYQNLSFPYQFTLVDDADHVDYSAFNYFYSDSFQIKNKPLEGLVVGKRVESSNGSDFTNDFTFEVSILTEDGKVDTEINEEYGDMIFVNGVATFTLRHKEQLSARNMPPGTKFRVEEKDADGYTVSATVGETSYEGSSYLGETSPEYTLVTFTNTKEDNPSGYVLPSTGGPGTGLFLILGSILIAGAGWLLCRRQKRV